MFIEELCEKDNSFSIKDKKKRDDKEAEEEIRNKAMERMTLKKNQMNPLEAAPKRAKEAGVKRLNPWKKKLKLNTGCSIRQRELQLQRKEQEVRARHQELQIELIQKQTLIGETYNSFLLTIECNTVAIHHTVHVRMNIIEGLNSRDRGSAEYK